MKKIVIIFAVLLALQANAQVVSDVSKQKQLQSMEVGPIDFDPAAYYRLIHDKPLGDGYAKYTWKWRGLHSGWKLNPSKSKAKPVAITYRTPQAVEQAATASYSKQELAEIEHVAEEDALQALDRNVDLAYANYKGSFNEMQAKISEALNYCLELEDEYLNERVENIQYENEFICEQVDYIHKTGSGYELENAKREKAYEELEEKMQKIVTASKKLARYAYVLKNKKQKTITRNYD